MARGRPARMKMPPPNSLKDLRACRADDEWLSRRRATWQLLFFVWSTLFEQKWSTSGERRGTASIRELSRSIAYHILSPQYSCDRASRAACDGRNVRGGGAAGVPCRGGGNSRSSGQSRITIVQGPQERPTSPIRSRQRSKRGSPRRLSHCGAIARCTRHGSWLAIARSKCINAASRFPSSP